MNKVETKVELLFDVANSSYLSEDQRKLILRDLNKQIDSGGILRIVSQESRSQWKNRETATKRFVTILQNVLRIRKKRHATTPTAVSVEKRLKEKKKRGSLKGARRKSTGYSE